MKGVELAGVTVLDHEVYYTSEAARLLGVATATLGNWLNGYTRDGRSYPPILRGETRRGGDQRMIAWGEFIEAGHLAAYRRQDRIPLQRLRDYVEHYRAVFDIPYPLAHLKPLAGHDRHLLDHDPDLTEIWRFWDGQRQIPSDSKHFHSKIDPSGEQSAPASDKRRSMEAFIKRIDFDGETAVRYWPAGRETDVVVDPIRQFGSPIIEGTCIRTSTISGMNSAGDSVEWLARTYELQPAQVEAAISFEQQLTTRSIAAYTAA